MTKERIISAAIAIPVVVLLLWLKPLYYLMNGIIVVFFVNEFMSMNSVDKKWVPLFLAFFAPFFILKGWSIYYLIGTFYVLLVYSLFWIGSKKGAKFNSTAFFAIVYAAILSFTSLVLRMRHGSFLLLNMFVVIWVADSAAYFVGSRFGKHKLMEKISPNKTVEGSIGSVLGAIAVQLLLAPLFKIGISWPVAIFWGFAISVFAQVGDLIESMFKRSAGVKDSGNIMPGHGGVMDRLDSILFTAPLYYFFIELFL